MRCTPMSRREFHPQSYHAILLGRLPPPISPMGPGCRLGTVKIMGFLSFRWKKKLTWGTNISSPISRKKFSIPFGPVRHMSDKCIDKCQSPDFEGTLEGTFNHPDKDGKSKPENDMEHQCKDTERWREDHHTGKNANTTLGKCRKPHPGNPVIGNRDQHQQAKTKDKSQ